MHYNTTMVKVLVSVITLLISLKSFAVIEVVSSSVETINLTGTVQQLVFTQEDSDKIKIYGYEKAASLKNKTIDLTLEDNKQVEIRGPSVLINAHLKSAKVQITKWSKDLKINLINGKIISSKTSGSLMLVLQKGDVSVFEHTGALKTEVYNADVLTQSVKGDQSHTLFSGTLKIEKNKGAVHVNTFQGQVKQSTGEGSFHFESQRGQLNLASFKGQIEAESAEGNLQVGLIEESMANLKTQSGKINVQIAPNLGVGIRAVVKEGDLYLPGELKVVRTATEKSFLGTYRPEMKKANLVVKSVDGSVFIK